MRCFSRFSHGIAPRANTHCNDYIFEATRSRSSRRAVIVSQQAADVFATFNVTLGPSNVVAGIDDFVAQPLVITFAVIMDKIRSCGSSQRRFAEEDIFKRHSSLMLLTKHSAKPVYCGVATRVHNSLTCEFSRIDSNCFVNRVS